MGTTDRYTDDLTIKLSSGKTLTFDADNISFTGSISSSGTLGNTVISGTLSVSGQTTLNGSLVVNGDITKESSLEISASGVSSDIDLVSDRDISFAASRDLTMTIIDDLDINVSDNINIDSVGTTSITAESSLNLTGNDAGDSVSLRLNSSGFLCQATSDSSFIYDILNDSTLADADVLRIRTLTESPDDTTRYITFSHGVSQTVTGLIRGAATDTDAAFITEGVSGNSTASGPTDTVEVNTTGDAVFVSGSADYGEFIKCGNIDEWPVSLKEGQKYIGLPEGYIVFVKNKAFYKEPVGTPMVVSHRSIIVGNEKADDKSVGQILSFIGQVPVFVKGAVNSGDFIVPDENFWGKAISPDEITFDEYIRVIGVAWESSANFDLKKVICAVGVKNI